LDVVFVDGQSQGNEQRDKPRKARVAIAYSESDGAIDVSALRIFWEPIGDKTNNEAEYQALLGALALINQRWTDAKTGQVPSHVGTIIIRSDSKLVVNQVHGEWRVEDPKLTRLNQDARKSIKKLASIRLEWIPREENFAGLWLEGRFRPASAKRMNEWHRADESGDC